MRKTEELAEYWYEGKRLRGEARGETDEEGETGGRKITKSVEKREKWGGEEEGLADYWYRGEKVARRGEERNRSEKERDDGDKEASVGKGEEWVSAEEELTTGFEGRRWRGVARGETGKGAG